MINPEGREVIDPREIEMPFSESVTLSQRDECVLVNNSFVICLTGFEWYTGQNRAQVTFFADGKVSFARSSFLKKSGVYLGSPKSPGTKRFVSTFRSDHQEDDSIYVDNKHLVVTDTVERNSVTFTINSVSPVEIQNLGVIPNQIALFKQKNLESSKSRNSRVGP